MAATVAQDLRSAVDTSCTDTLALCATAVTSEVLRTARATSFFTSPSFHQLMLFCPATAKQSTSRNKNEVTSARKLATMEVMDSLSFLAVVSGISAHVAVFSQGEWDVASPSIFAFYVLSLSAGALASSFGFTETSIPHIVKLFSYHVLGLFLSILVYRGLFHRLSRFPGPVLARLTNFYITARSMKKLHLFLEIQDLHAKYGDYVRVGEH